MIVCVTELFEYCNDTRTYLIDLDKLPLGSKARELIEAFVEADKKKSFCQLKMDYSDFQNEIEVHDSEVEAPQMVEALTTVYFD